MHINPGCITHLLATNTLTISVHVAVMKQNSIGRILRDTATLRKEGYRSYYS